MATLPRAHAIEVLLHADLATARRETFDTIGVLEPVGDGTVLFAQADDLDWFARELSRLPFGFEVRHPATLRVALRDHAHRLQHLAM
jgi:predicted DNA-binding transcriptional regulator YafY